MSFNSDTAFGGLVDKQNAVHITYYRLFHIWERLCQVFCGFGKVKRDDVGGGGSSFLSFSLSTGGL